MGIIKRILYIFSIFILSLNFYIVHNQFWSGNGSKCCDTAYEIIASRVGNHSIMANRAKGFYNHFANVIIKEGLIYCIWEEKEGISNEEFEEIIDGPSG